VPSGWVLIVAAAAVIVGLAIVNRVLGLVVLLALIAALALVPGARHAISTAWDQPDWGARSRCLGAALSAGGVWTGDRSPSSLPECRP
jgi:hypothetical protein